MGCGGREERVLGGRPSRVDVFKGFNKVTCSTRLFTDLTRSAKAPVASVADHCHSR